jgi:hypothetical protein
VNEFAGESSKQIGQVVRGRKWNFPCRLVPAFSPSCPPPFERDEEEEGFVRRDERPRGLEIERGRDVAMARRVFEFEVREESDFEIRSRIRRRFISGIRNNKNSYNAKEHDHLVQFVY